MTNSRWHFTLRPSREENSFVERSLPKFLTTMFSTKANDCCTVGHRSEDETPADETKSSRFEEFASSYLPRRKEGKEACVSRNGYRVDWQAWRRLERRCVRISNALFSPAPRRGAHRAFKASSPSPPDGFMNLRSPWSAGD